MTTRLQSSSDNELGPAEFCVVLYFEREMTPAQQVLQASATFLDSLEKLDVALAASIFTEIEHRYTLEEIRDGSIWTKIGQALTNVDDEALRNLNIRQILGGFLVKAKYRYLRALEEQNGLPPKPELEALSNELHEMAQATGLHELPHYHRPYPGMLAEAAYNLAEGLNTLRDDESIKYSCSEGVARLDNSVKITREDVDNILTERELSNISRVILRVKRPDFIGNSKWDFRYGRASISANFADTEWLKAYQEGQIDFRPGDALEVILHIRTQYDAYGEVIHEENTVEKVVRMIPGSEARRLRLPD